MWPTRLWSSFLIEKVGQLCEVVLCSTTSPPLLFCLPPLYQLSNDHQVSHLSKNCHNEKPTMCQTNLNLNWTLYRSEPERKHWSAQIMAIAGPLLLQEIRNYVCSVMAGDPSGPQSALVGSCKFYLWWHSLLVAVIDPRWDLHWLADAWRARDPIKRGIGNAPQRAGEVGEGTSAWSFDQSSQSQVVNNLW